MASIKNVDLTLRVRIRLTRSVRSTVIQYKARMGQGESVEMHFATNGFKSRARSKRLAQPLNPCVAVKRARYFGFSSLSGFFS